MSYLPTPQMWLAELVYDNVLKQDTILKKKIVGAEFE